jgi:CheY-like chemotaxis protein
MPARETVLIIDDDPSIGQLMPRILDVLGWNGMYADTGQEALQILGVLDEVDRQPAAIFLDATMVEMHDGILLDVLHTTTAAPVIVMSGFTLHDVLQRIHSTEWFLPKPFSISDVQRILGLVTAQPALN